MDKGVDIVKAEFVVNVDTLVANKSYKGVFTFKYPTVRDGITVGTETVRNLGGLSAEVVDGITFMQARGLAILAVLCTGTPDWCVSHELLPEDVVMDVYAGYTQKKESFRLGGSGGDGLDNGESSNEDAGTGSESDRGSE